MSLIVALTGSMSLFLGYKTYNSYYNQQFEYIEGFEEDVNIKTQEDIKNPIDLGANKIVPEEIKEEIPEEIPEDIPDDIKEEIPEEIPEDIPEEIKEDIPEEIPEDILLDKPISKKFEEDKLVLNLLEPKQIKMMDTIYENEPIQRYPRNNLRRRKKKNKKRKY
jgi:hypothetical protein